MMMTGVSSITSSRFCRTVLGPASKTIPAHFGPAGCLSLQLIENKMIIFFSRLRTDPQRAASQARIAVAVEA